MELHHIKGNTYCLMGRSAIGLYRFDGNKCILLDNGESREYDELTGFLKKEGLTPAGLLVSHAHLDHHGNSKRLREEYNIPLAMSIGEAALISSKVALDRYTNYFGRSAEEQLSIDYYQMCPVDLVIGPEQDSIELCGIPFAIYHLPGHSYDHIAAATPDGVCFCGDVLLTENVLRHVKLPYCDHVALDLKSKEQVADLPYHHWIFSHKGAVEGDIHELAAANCALVRLRMKELSELLRTPMNREEFYQASRDLLDMRFESTDQLVRQERHLRPYLEQMVINGTVVMEVKDRMIYFRNCQGDI